MMMGLGFWLMLSVVSVPILLVASLLMLLLRPILRRMDVQAGAGPGRQILDASLRVCSHCSAPLQRDWAHCPQCGAPVDA